MTEPMINAGKPLICTFRELAQVTHALHQNDRGWLDNLHDVWMMGAPTPNSIVRDPKHYDPRLKQKGNYEARIVFPTALAKWVISCIQTRGFNMTIEQAFDVIDTAFALASGDIHYVLNKPIQIQVTK